MENEKLKLIVENEKEWRMFLVKKVEKIEKDLNNFKLKVLSFASIFGGLAGFGADFIKKLF